MGAWKNGGFMNRQRKLMRPGGKKKICFCLLTMNPIKSHVRFNFSYTVRRQHPTTEHQHSKYSFDMCTAKLHCPWILEPIPESMAINLQWVSRSPASLVNP